MAWQQRLADWMDQQVERLPGLDHWLEQHAHALGYHGPTVRRALALGVVPLGIVALGVLIVVIVAVVRRRRAGRRKAAPA